MQEFISLQARHGRYALSRQHSDRQSGRHDVRAVCILREVQFIAAEDTRITRALLDHYGIDTPLTTYHQLNKEEKTPIILNRLSNGHDVALVSDAGTPVIADPGAFLVSNTLAAGYESHQFLELRRSRPHWHSPEYRAPNLSFSAYFRLARPTDADSLWR